MSCTATYQGESFPAFHGTRCVREGPHENQRHTAVVNGRLLQWWTDEEKKQQRAKRDIREKP